MTNRATPDDVMAILYDADELDSDSLEPMITPANLIVTEYLAGQDLSDALLAQIEIWLAAHFTYMSILRQASTVKIGKAEESYAWAGKDLRATTYGQMVLTLDSTGLLATMGDKSIEIRAITEHE